jgi:hypothetical protein
LVIGELLWGVPLMGVARPLFYCSYQVKGKEKAAADTAAFVLYSVSPIRRA